MLKLDYPLVWDVFDLMDTASHNITSMGVFRAKDGIKSRGETTLILRLPWLPIHKCGQKVLPHFAKVHDRDMVQALQVHFPSNKSVFHYTTISIILISFIHKPPPKLVITFVICTLYFF